MDRRNGGPVMFSPFTFLNSERGITLESLNNKQTVRDMEKTSALYGRDLADGLKKLRSDDKYTDFTICVGDKKFKCHRVVLAALSEYFQIMFDLGGLETESGSVCLDDMGLDEDTCADLLNFIYTGNNIVTLDNADILLHVAHMIQIRSLHALCKDFLKARVSKLNCVRVWQISQNHVDTADLSEISRSLILKHFAEIADSEEKLDMVVKVESLIEILDSDNVNAINRSGLFLRVAFSWIRFDFDNRRIYFDKLCEALTKIGVHIKDILDGAKEVEEFYTVPDIISTLTKFKNERTQGTGTTFSTPADDVLVVIGGSEGGSNCSVMCFSFPQKVWFTLKPVPLDPGYNFALCSSGTDMYVSGGSGPGPNSYTNGGGATFLQFCGESQDWIQLPVIPKGRQYHVMYAVGTSVYVLGGKEGTLCTNKVYTYDCRSVQWRTNATNMYEAVRSAAHVCIGKKIYLFGGFLQDNTMSNTIQCFDCEYDQSYRVFYAIPDSARLNTRALYCNGKLLLICKNGGVFECSEKDSTRKIASICNFDRKGFGACCFEDKILICGGEVSFSVRNDMLLCDVRSSSIQPIKMQETMPFAMSNFCFVKAKVLRTHLTTECATTMKQM